MDANQRCLVEIVDQLDDEDLEEVTEDLVTTTEISLQAFSRTFNPCMIRLTRWVQSWPLSVLIDNGNTHNFIQESVVMRLSRKYLVYKDVFCQVVLSIQNTEGSQHCARYPMVSYTGCGNDKPQSPDHGVLLWQ